MIHLPPQSKQCDLHLNKPPYSMPFHLIKRHNGYPIGFNHPIITHSRPPNLRNLLSYQNIEHQHGPPTLAHLTRGSQGTQLIESPTQEEHGGLRYQEIYQDISREIKREFKREFKRECKRERKRVQESAREIE
eukprot:2030085-Ditylum_brightwellii.AAC.1